MHNVTSHIVEANNITIKASRIAEDCGFANQHAIVALGKLVVLVDKLVVLVDKQVSNDMYNE